MRHFLLAGLTCIGCSDSACVIPPCLEPVALEITITPLSGGPVVASVAISGPVVETLSCGATCEIRGSFGAYVLDITATGYATVHDTVQVHGTRQKCGCDIVQTQDIQVALVPTS